MSDELASGLREVVLLKMKDQVKAESAIKVHNKYDQIGTIDLLLEFESIGPLSRVFIPNIIALPRKNLCFRYCMMTVHQWFNRKNNQLSKFVHLFHNLCKSEWSAGVKTNHIKDTVLSDPSTIFVFAFCGADVHSVCKQMQEEITKVCGNTDMKIHGHDVSCVWVNDVEVVLWKLNQQMLELKARNKTLKRELRRVNKRTKKLADFCDLGGVDLFDSTDDKLANNNGMDGKGSVSQSKSARRPECDEENATKKHRY